MRVITFVCFVAVFAALFSLSSCNTIQGLGEDMQQGGRAIEDVAD
jgi:predicted small secreted protein